MLKGKQGKDYYLPRVIQEKDLTTCLVAGGAGFIGSFLCESLVNQNCFVYCLDNFSTGREKNIERLKKNQNFQLINYDLQNTKTLSLPKKVDYTFHVASAEAYLNGLDISLETLLANSFGTKALLDFSRENKAKFLLASSCQVYSGFISQNNLAQYFGKSHSMETESAFLEAKRFSEALVFEYFKKYQLNARVVRMDFLYGPRMNFESGNLLAKLFADALETGKIKVPGNGLTRLYPTYVSDAVYGLVKAMFSQASNGRIFTLIKPSMITILNFAYLMRDLSRDKKLDVNLVAGEDLYNFDFPQKETIESQERLGWYPKVEVNEGIKKTLEWLRKEKIYYQKESKTHLFENKTTDKQPSIEKKIEKKNFPIKIPDFITNKNLQEKKVVMKKVVGENEKSLKTLEKPFLNKQNDPSKQSLEAKNKVGKTRFHISWLLVMFCLVLLTALLPIIAFAGNIYLGIGALKKSQIALETIEIEDISRQNLRAKKHFSSARKLLLAGSWIAGLVNIDRQILVVDGFLQSGIYLTNGVNQLLESIDRGNSLVAMVLDKKPGNPIEEINNLKTNFTQANTSLGFTEAEIRKIKPLFSRLEFLGMGKQLDYLEANLPAWRQKIADGERVLQILPEFLGYPDKQVYLVLLQNNQELRPTGGFIGSFALLTFDKGKILDLKVEDVYTADGQLKGFVAPPEPIKKYLGENSWWLRDSNISPDFPTSAARAAWFLQKEMNQEVSGVIGINLQTIQNILASIGPVYLNDYQEQIDKNNVFERAEYHSEVNFFPGSTQKKDFLGSLTRIIYDRLKQVEAKEIVSLAQTAINSLNQKSIMAWLPGTNSSSLLAQYGWDGSLRETPKSLPGFSQIRTTDYLMPVEANFGVNKANYFISRKSSQEVTISKNGAITEKYQLELNNQSASNTWPGGGYKNYLRLYLPMDTQLESVEIVNKGKTIRVETDNIDKTIELNKKVFGFLVEIGVKQKAVITVNYQRKTVLPLNQRTTNYLFYWQKQPGTGDDEIRLTINHPLFLKPVKISSSAQTQPGSLVFNAKLDTDRLFAIAFSR